jgi:hypothetical protein
LTIPDWAAEDKYDKKTVLDPGLGLGNNLDSDILGDDVTGRGKHSDDDPENVSLHDTSREY